jgi:DNA-binding PadR family transcriptional regulator
MKIGVMRELTAFQRDILYAVGDQDSPYGLAIKRELEEYYSEEVNHGRL